MSTSSHKQQKKGKHGMGNAGKRKEMVKDRRVQEGRKPCVSKLCVRNLCVNKLCVRKLCGDKLCVRCVCVPVCLRAEKTSCVLCSGEVVWTNCVRTSCM